jgi:hypothetical protein
MTIDERLFGDLFADPSWAAWRACTAAVFGEPMSASELDVYRACTGRQRAPEGPFRRVVIIKGRRGGGTRRAASWAVRIATRDYRGVLAPGEIGTLPIIASDRQQARNAFNYVCGLVDAVPFLSRLVVARTSESIELATRCRIEIHTASYRAIRGYTVVGAVCDEVAFWRSDDSANPDREIVSALEPAMATVRDAPLILISSPYSRHGVLWDEYRRHWGKDDAATLVWKAETRRMNPTIPAGLIDQAMAEDEAAARAEYLAEFRSDVDRLVTAEAVDACVEPGRLELPPVADVSYVGFCDPSGGSADSMTLALAHLEHDVAVLDCVREVRPPFSPDDVVAEFAAKLRAYRCTRVTGDRYAGEWVAERFQRHGVSYVASEQVKSEIYLAAVPLLNARRCALLDLPRLRGQFLGLERRTARGGKDSVDHGPGAHDDVANAVAGALVAAVGSAVHDGYYGFVLRELERYAAAKVEAPALGIRERTTPELTAEQRERRLQALERMERRMRPSIPREWRAGS